MDIQTKQHQTSKEYIENKPQIKYLFYFLEKNSFLLKNLTQIRIIQYYSSSFADYKRKSARIRFLKSDKKLEKFKTKLIISVQ